MTSVAAATGQEGHGPGAPEAEHAHPGTATYVKVGAALGILTLIEIAIPAFNLFGVFGNPVLIGLAAIKFGTVVAFYMHLKFDNRLFTYMFGFGLFVAAGIITALLFLFSQDPLPPPPAGMLER